MRQHLNRRPFEFTQRVLINDALHQLFCVKVIHAAADHAAARAAAGELPAVAGGGDTVAALNKAGAAERFSYISTAGGAFLEWMEGKTLPGVAALG